MIANETGAKILDALYTNIYRTTVILKRGKNAKNNCTFIVKAKIIGITLFKEKFSRKKLSKFALFPRFWSTRGRRTIEVSRRVGRSGGQVLLKLTRVYRKMEV